MVEEQQVSAGYTQITQTLAAYGKNCVVLLQSNGHKEIVLCILQLFDKNKLVAYPATRMTLSVSRPDLIKAV